MIIDFISRKYRISKCFQFDDGEIFHTNDLAFWQLWTTSSGHFFIILLFIFIHFFYHVYNFLRATYYRESIFF